MTETRQACEDILGGLRKLATKAEAILAEAYREDDEGEIPSSDLVIEASKKFERMSDMEITAHLCMSMGNKCSGLICERCPLHRDVPKPPETEYVSGTRIIHGDGFVSLEQSDFGSECDDDYNLISIHSIDLKRVIEAMSR